MELKRCNTPPAAEPEASPRGWEWPWWRTTRHDFIILPWVILIHLTAPTGLILFPLPGWRVFVGVLALAWIGGLGTTLCYHRALVHRSLKLHPALSAVLTFFAMFNSSGSPITWTASHRAIMPKADTVGEVPSPALHGFWWVGAHAMVVAGGVTVGRSLLSRSQSFQVPDMEALQPAILALSYFGGLYFSPPAFFWLGSIRMVYALHAQCFVNSICHTQPNTPFGMDSDRNVKWLGWMHLLQGENWHRNHRARRPGIARLGWNWHQPDVGYTVVCISEKVGLVSDVRRASGVVGSPTASTITNPARE